MNPLTRLYRRSLPFRFLCYALVILAWLVLFFISDDTLAGNSETANRILLSGWLIFAAIAWWYGEDRDRRRAARAKRDGASTETNDG